MYHRNLEFKGRRKVQVKIFVITVLRKNIGATQRDHRRNSDILEVLSVEKVAYSS